MSVRKLAHHGAAPNTVAAGDLSRLRVQPADQERDLDVLADHLGQREYFADRLDRQKHDNGVLLMVWLNDRPIGCAYLWLEEAEEPELREYLPRVPLLTHVEIKEEFRSRGIGAYLISIAEKTLIERGYQQVALAVDVTNPRAEKLYERLGYRIWQHPKVPYLRCDNPFDDNVESPEICNVMIKDLC